LEISISILTFNRPDILKKNLAGLMGLTNEVCEIIVIDNSTNDQTQKMMSKDFPLVKYIKNPVNMGVAGRNRGIQEAIGDVVVTLDDDVTDFSLDDVATTRARFDCDPGLGALCFRVLHYETGEICNWCHPRPVELDGLGRFITYEISEGAVAFSKAALRQTSLYFEKFFISHEGKDLAFRIMNQGFSVEYDGRIWVTHSHEVLGRADWRRYYFDTRNTIWIAIRNMPFAYGVRFLVRSLSAMLVYSVRDRFLKYWLMAIFDGVKEGPAILETREVWAVSTKVSCHEIDRRKPSFLYMLKKRLFRRGVQI